LIGHKKHFELQSKIN